MHVIVRYPTGFYTQTLPSEKEKSLALVYGADLSPHQRSKTKPIDLHWFGPQVWPNNGRNSKITDTHTHTAGRMVAIAELSVASRRCTKTETQQLAWAMTSEDKV
jgi:hypothetical protein